MSQAPTDEKIGTPDAAPIEVGLDNTKGDAIDSKQVDLAANFLLNAENYGPLTPEAEKRLKRKIDWVMVPMVSDMFNHY